MTDTLSPADLSLPIPGWRNGQYQIIEQLVGHLTRGGKPEPGDPPIIAAACLPPGYGKSVIGMGVANFLRLSGEIEDGERVVIGTKTKGLEDQYVESGFGGLVDVRGKDNYRCSRFRGFSCAEAWSMCGAGVGAGCSSACTGYAAARDEVYAPDTTTAVTNYSYWVRTSWENVGLFICDEAHEAAEAVRDSLSLELSRETVESLFGKAKGKEFESPEEGQEGIWWDGWASEASSLVDRLKLMGRGLSLTDAKRLVQAERIVNSVGELDDDWVHTTGKMYRTNTPWVKATPAYVGKYMKRKLWKGVPRILLLSATFRPAQLSQFGLKMSTVPFIDMPPVFPKARAPLYFYSKAPAVKWGMGESEKYAWVCQIDNILRKRMALGWHGLVQLGSYERTAYFVKHSEFGEAHGKGGRNICSTHTDARGVAEAVERHRSVPIGTASLLVSPSIGTGYDFKDDECRINIIGKIPFRETKDPVMKKIMEKDKTYGASLALQDLVQWVGRLQRSDRDWGENWIVDGQGKWFLPFAGGKGSNRNLVPREWEAIWTDEIPDPLDIAA